MRIQGGGVDAHADAPGTSAAGSASASNDVRASGWEYAQSLSIELEELRRELTEERGRRADLARQIEQLASQLAHTLERDQSPWT